MTKGPDFVQLHPAEEERRRWTVEQAIKLLQPGCDTASLDHMARLIYEMTFLRSFLPTKEEAGRAVSFSDLATGPKGRREELG